MVRLFNALNVSIHCKIIFISRQNNFVCALFKYLKSLGSPQHLRFYLLVPCFSHELFIFGRSENRSECMVDVHNN